MPSAHTKIGFTVILKSKKARGDSIDMRKENERMDSLSKVSGEMTLAIASIPCQEWKGTYENLEDALNYGTIFPQLHMPFYMGGDENGK